MNLQDDDDDDAWVSSESGADTPNRYNESDTDSDSETTTSATPIVREVVMRPPRVAKRTSSTGSGKHRPVIARTETSKQSRPAAVQTQQQRVSQMVTKGPPSPVSPNPVPPSHSAPLSRQPADSQMVTSVPNQQTHNGPPHLTADEAQRMRRAEAERRRVEADRAQSEFPPQPKVNGSLNSRLPPPGQFLESQSRAGYSRPPSARGLSDYRLMEPTAAARFAQAIASQDQDPDQIAAALSKPSSPNVKENKLSSQHRVPSEPASALARTNGIKTDVSDHRRHSSLAVGTEGHAINDGATSPKGKRHSRPSSIYSVSSKHLRPHPLIRGQSHGPSAPLAPLAVMPDSAKAQLSTSVPKDNDFPPSPLSVSTAPSSPEGPSSQSRRPSVSSARSVATLPLPPTNKDARWGDRTRTLSTISSSSTIAALSSLVHHQITPSHRISFFPNIDEEDIQKIHSLPPPGVTNSHLQYIAHRSPLRESYDRIMRAKAGKVQ